MAQPESTCWTVIQAAAAGAVGEREQFARRYAPVVRAYLAARWRQSPCLGELDDAAQEVFVECFKQGGALGRAAPDRPGGFRAFLYGLVRNVARRVEEDRARAREQQPSERDGLDWVPAAEASLSRAFDRAWAKALLREAGRLQEERAAGLGAAAQRRVELLQLRFHEGLPIRDVARRWGVEAAALHHEYARARKEFKAALAEVVAFHQPGSAEEVERACADLLELLG
jgi:RNA polymerase sigma-70 factor (ECF subfamily)